MLDEWLSDNALHQWARKIAQPVTSFVIESNGEFHIRWFSLEREISLCGHGSLGAGAAILIKYALNEITFKSQYGDVVIAKQNALYRITLPAWQAQACTVSGGGLN